jgi:hypothetical protein
MTPEPSGPLVDRLATYFERGGLDPVRARQAAVDLFADPKTLAQLGRDLVEMAARADAPYPVACLCVGSLRRPDAARRAAQPRI